MFNTVVLHLSLINGIGPATIKYLVEKKPSTISWRDIYHFSVTDFVHLFNVTLKTAERIVAGLQDTSVLESECNLLAKHTISIVTITDDLYPEYLKNIHIPPAVLYWSGDSLDLQSKHIAIVGSRKADSYTKKVIQKLVSPLVAHDWRIVSGGAIGADTMAHQEVLNNKGKTVVVLGSGLLHPYPRENIKLFDQIKNGHGTILSIFPLNTYAQPGNFPARNRVIAGLSHGCVVVAAARKSGARITAEYALEQGREVFAIPGKIDDPLSEGCHELIKQGATLVSCVQDVFSAFGQLVDESEQIAKPIESVMQNALPFLQNDPRAKVIILCKTAQSIDELVQKMNMSLSEMQELLFSLQMEGFVEQEFSGKWFCS